MHMGGSDNTGEGLASQHHRYRVQGQPLLNRHQVGGVSRSPDGLFARYEEEPTRGRLAVRGQGTTREPQTTPNTSTRHPPSVPPTPPSVPLHCHITQQGLLSSTRLCGPKGGCQRPGEPAPSGPPLGPLKRLVGVSVRAGDRAPRGPTLGPLQRDIALRLRPGDPAPSGPPLGPLRRTVERSGGQRKGRNHRKNRAEPRLTVWPPCSINHHRNHADAHATRVNHNGAHATCEAHATPDQQGARHAHVRPAEWWSAGGGRPVKCAEERGTWASHTRNAAR